MKIEAENAYDCKKIIDEFKKYLGNYSEVNLENNVKQIQLHSKAKPDAILKIDFIPKEAGLSVTDQIVAKYIEKDYSSSINVTSLDTLLEGCQSAPDSFGNKSKEEIKDFSETNGLRTL